MSSFTIKTNVSVGSVRKCGVCSKPGHDKRKCPSGTTAATITKATSAKIKEPSAIHLSLAAIYKSGPAPLTDPINYWAAISSGPYPYPHEDDDDDTDFEC